MTDARTVVARVVFPVTDAAEVLPLYVDGRAEGAEVRGRTSVAVRAGTRLSLGSYFNSFPATYWAAETSIVSIRLTATVRGTGSLSVMRSDADARATEVQRRAIDGETALDLELDLGGFDEGGLYWLELEASASELVLEDARWSVAATEAGAATATVAMATFNRPADCHRQLRALAADPWIREVVDRIVVVDQGTDLVADQPGFAKTAEELGNALVIVRQANLGGSGGFSRGMLEALERNDGDHVLLLDDDAISEPEAIHRAIRFAAAADDRLIVGGGMLHLDDRAVLYTQSEQWDSRRGWVALDRPGAYDHDFVAAPLARAPYFHRRQRSDFNGWWMCLIPMSLLTEAGLALPLFLKQDDMEFALRARDHGVRTVSVPGIALWHMGWAGKAPTRTWEGYFLHRNRIITALLHTRRRRPTAIVVHSFLGDLKPLLTLQYSAVRLRAHALADVFAGPGALPAWLPTRAAAARQLWATFDDARPVEAGSAGAPPPSPPAGPIAAAATLVRLVWRHLVVRTTGGCPEPVEGTMRVRAAELGWWTFARADSAFVETSDGKAVVAYRRSRAETRRALALSTRLHLRLWWRWPSLARSFRTAAPELAAPASWAAAFRR